MTRGAADRAVGLMLLASAAVIMVVAGLFMGQGWGAVGGAAGILMVGGAAGWWAEQ